MAARSERKAANAIAALEADGIEPGSVVWLKLELSDMKSVKIAAEEFMSKETRLDILGGFHLANVRYQSTDMLDRGIVNNAGV